MLSLLLLGAVQSLSDSPAATTNSVAAVQAFLEGCERGALRLPASRGHKIAWKELPPWAEVRWWNQRKTVTAIKFLDPLSTYLVIADFAGVQPKGIRKSCVMLLRVIRSDEARFALLHSAPEIQPQQGWSKSWTVDLPRLGYRKSLRFLDDRTVMLEVDTYVSPWR